MIDKETLTQREIAEYCNTPPCSVCNWLNGLHKPNKEKQRLLSELGFDNSIWGDIDKITEFLKINGYSAVYYGRMYHFKKSSKIKG